MPKKILKFQEVRNNDRGEPAKQLKQSIRTKLCSCSREKNIFGSTKRFLKSMSEACGGKHPDAKLSLRGIASHANINRSNSTKQTMNPGGAVDPSKQGRPAIEIYRPPSNFQVLCVLKNDHLIGKLLSIIENWYTFEIFRVMLF